ncbi:MAG: hypothetical protein IPM83_12785 [Ignavibacteria bacterium]|nr:hypothetical protein [Ignavibacteria bacterium]
MRIPRYFRQEFRVDIPATGKYLEISKDFVVRTSEAGRTIAIAPSPFDLKKTTLKTGADEDLGRNGQGSHHESGHKR